MNAQTDIQSDADWHDNNVILKSWDVDLSLIHILHRGLCSDSSVHASVPDASMTCSAASSAGLESAPSVSYTHLDVYKRQVLCRPYDGGCCRLL